jgi:hypothetical protein
MILFFIKFKKNDLCSLLFFKHFLIFLNKNGSLFYFSLKLFFHITFTYDSNNIFCSFFNENISTNILRSNIFMLKFDFLRMFKKVILSSKKRILIKGLGFKFDFHCYKNRNFANIKSGYSHRILLQIPFSVSVIFTQNNNILLQNTNCVYLHLLSNLLFMIRKRNTYKQKGFFNSTILFISKMTRKKN